METKNKKITVETTVNAPVSKAWTYWSEPKHITQWCQPSPEWHAPHAENDFRKGGKFTTTMAAKDGSMSFDFNGEYTAVDENQLIEYTIEDGRTVSITFTEKGNQTHIRETFEMENQNPEEMQRGGWQAIIDSFKKYTEEN